MAPEPALCPCGSTRGYELCCLPIIRGERRAESAEALMRSRYSAYALGEIAHIVATIDPEKRDEHDAESIRRWSESSEWRGLEILSSDDESGSVEFVARYRNEDGEEVAHHELSQFRRIEGEWFFVDGQPIAPGTVRRESPKVGRNDPCPCGSGRKYKKCCA